MSDAAEQDPLGYSLFALDGLIEQWFDKDRRPKNDGSDEYRGIVRATQLHSHRVTFFGDREGIDMTPMLRFLRAVEERCGWEKVDEASVNDAVERVLLRHLSMRDEDIGELVTLDQVAPLTGKSKRTLERYLREGKLPEPDVHGGGGKAHKWIWKRLRPSLEKESDRQLPERFPGSRII